MQSNFKKYPLLFILIAVVIPFSRLSAQDSTSNLLRRTLINYFESVGAYDEAMNVLKAAEKIDTADIEHFFSLWKKRQELKVFQDSVTLVSAQTLINDGMDAEALLLFRQLRASPQESIRKRAVVVSDSLMLKQRPEWYKKYPWNVFPLKGVIPWLIICMVIAIICFIYNRIKNKKRIDVICRDKEEAASMRSSFQFIRNELESSFSEEQNAELVNSGPIRLLPHFAKDVSENFTNLVSVVAPSQISKILNIVWKAGHKPAYKLNVLVDRYDDDIILTVRLYKNGEMIQDWFRNTSKLTIQDFRLDLAYEVFILLRKQPQKKFWKWG